jgi:hypothetical protein
LFLCDHSQPFHHLLLEVSDWSYGSALLLYGNILRAMFAHC